MSIFSKFLNKLNNKPKNNPDRKPNLSIEEALSKSIEILNKHKRTAYIPIVKNTNTFEFSEHSKLGGYPYLRHKLDWPKCPNCQKHMQLFLQLNLNSLPQNSKKGFLQLFYCTNEDAECEYKLDAYEAFSKASNCRIIQYNGTSTTIIPDIDSVFEEKIIIDWKAVDDYPHYYEYESLGIVLPNEDEVIDLLEERKIATCLDGDKLFGWPFWIQDVEYSNDRNTNKAMQVIFQLDSENNIPYMFGDSGIGHLSQSNDNINELAFTWSCY